MQNTAGRHDPTLHKPAIRTAAPVETDIIVSTQETRQHQSSSSPFERTLFLLIQRVTPRMLQFNLWLSAVRFAQATYKRERVDLPLPHFSYMYTVCEKGHRELWPVLSG